MRIGIHTGWVIAGIIGSNIVWYDIFGSDVLIANKMESNGEQGHVCCSEDTRRIILKTSREKFKFEKHTTVKAASINWEIKAYKVFKWEVEQNNSIPSSYSDISMDSSVTKD